MLFTIYNFYFIHSYYLDNIFVLCYYTSVINVAVYFSIFHDIHTVHVNVYIDRVTVIMTTTMIRKQNKGFSLIELIIVVAIIATLTALLAPQYLKYVERAREARDMANIMSVYEAFQIAVIDPSVDVNGAGSEAIKPENGAPITYYAAGYLYSIGPTLKNAFSETYGTQGRYTPGTTTEASNRYYLSPLVSKKFKDGVVFRFSYSGASEGLVGTKKGYIRVYMNPID